jgi:hypothetical protein
LHEKYQALFSKFGRIVEIEQSHYDEERMLYFTPDAIIELGGERYLVEIKGYKQETFDTLDEMGEPPQAAHHQCQFYMHLLGIERGIILVECKDNQHYKVWVVERDKEIALTYTERCYAFKGALTLARAQGKLPARKCGSCKDRLAEKCVMRRVCFQLEG